MDPLVSRDATSPPESVTESSRMPLMLLNLRAMPHGLESHREFLRTEVEAWLTGAAEETDVTFICTGVDTEERSQAVRLAAHQVRPNIFTSYQIFFLTSGWLQAVLAPVSEVLREMFVLHSCSHVRNMINISIDCDPKVKTKTLVDLLHFDNKLIIFSIVLCRFSSPFCVSSTTGRPICPPPRSRR